MASPLIAGAGAAVVLVSVLVGTAHTQTATNQLDPGYFDLGFTLTDLPRDSAGAKKWLAAQDPAAQRVIVAACDNYIKHPIAVDMAETVVFCTALLAK